MPLDFPNVPTPGQVWIASNGVAYVWDGSKWVVQAPAGSTGTVVNTFNTRAGNVTLLNSDVTTALGYTPSRSDVINVMNFGAKGDGTTDDTAAIQAAAAAIPAIGGTLLFPAGTYKVSGTPTIIRSHTRVLGEGRELSVIRPNGLTPWTFPGGQDVQQVFAGYLYSQLGPFAITPTPPGGTYDTDIAIEGIGFDFTQQANASDGVCIASFMFAQRVMLANLALWSTTGASTACTGVRIIACDRVTMHDSRGDNVVQMLDCWGGTTRVKISNLDVVQCPGGGNGGVFNLQGVGTNNNSGHSYQYEAVNINVQANGGCVFFLDSMGGGSITSDVLLANINVVAIGGSNAAVIGRGRGGRIKVHNMNCTALAGASWSMPILLGSFWTYQPKETGTNKISTTSGSNIITVTFANGTDAGVGNYVSIDNGSSGALVANGLTLLGCYLVTSITSTANNLNMVVTCDARANATATGPIAATTGIVGFQGCFSNCELNGITFDGAQTSGQPVISIQGNGHQISNLNVTTNYGSATTPQYSVLIATDGTSIPSQYETARAISIDNVEGAPGAGPVPSGYSGDTVVSWNQYAPTPIRLNVNGSTYITATGSTTPRTLASRFADVINVKDYGATGNGTTDDTTAIKAAITALPSSGSVLSFPPGTYLITSQLQIPSNTLVRGPATLLAGGVFPMLTNLHASATTLTDTNIAIDAMTFDYGSSGAGGGYHCIDMIYVRNVCISDCTFQCRGAGNGTSMIACYNTMVQNCTAYGFSNCAYDHWQGPRNAKVIGCYAETASSAQIVNFNPDPTTGSGSGWVADGFVLADCVFVATGTASIPMQLEPLGPGGTAQNIQVTGNTFKNVYLSCRRATRSATISGNTFDQIVSDIQAFACYPLDGGTPDGIVFIGNTIVDPGTGGDSYAAVMVTGINSVVAGNAFSGTSAYACTYTTSGVATGGNSYPTDAYTALGTPGSFNASTLTSNLVDFGRGNAAPPTLTTRSAGTKVVLYDNMSSTAVDYGIGLDSGKLWFCAGDPTTSFDWYVVTTKVANLGTNGLTLDTGNLNFNNRLASVGTDLSQGIQFYSGYGLSCSSDHGGAVNVVTGSTVQFYVNGARLGEMDSSGINMQIGAVTPYAGTFAGIHFGAQYASAYNDLSKHIDLYNGQVGISYTNNTAMNLVSGGGATFYAGTTQLALFYPSGLILYQGHLSFTPRYASSITDLSQHIDLYNGQMGIQIGPSGALRFVAVPAGITFNVGGADVGFVAAEGLDNIAIGASYPSTGNFTHAAFSSGVTFGSYAAGSPTDLSHHIDLYGGQYGLSVTGATVNIVVGGTAIANISNLTNGITSVGQMQIFGTSGPTWTSGSAAPSSTQPVGSLYSRVGGAVGATLYVSRGAGTWAAVAGV